MRRAVPGLLPSLVLPGFLLLAPLPALAGGPDFTNGPDCGGDAYSSATIGTNPPGPLTAVPETLCADLAQGRAPDPRIEVIVPGIGSSGQPSPPYGDPYGDRVAPAPYDGRPLPGPRPPRGRFPER
ncbi:hypothetical protein [Methylobacterium sp. SyP6R]|uniref:hypothetical protein n=1 Tax=Methylobacterium sp. SyP6R TaxID=2718876 RepID=UPI001F35AD72|nr:hypothetical protein [Methylobacterium sp. SyP6R]MCF4126932.1 hypothetical protein [Methylobacterium sp. SyP6R]